MSNNLSQPPRNGAAAVSARQKEQKVLARKLLDTAKFVYCTKEVFHGNTARSSLSIKCIFDNLPVELEDVKQPAPLRYCRNNPDGYLRPHEQEFIENLFEGYLQCGYAPFEAAKRAFHQLVLAGKEELSLLHKFFAQQDLDKARARA